MIKENGLEKAPKGVLVFIDDDPDEFLLLQQSLEKLELRNKVVFCRDGQEAFDYLKHTKDDIFVIISDMNMPVMDGLTLKRLIEMTPELKIKAIPFFFHSSTSSTAEIRAAYDLNIQ